MNERCIQEELLSFCSNYRYVIPNVHIPKWFEADMFGITRADYSVEFEIKITKSDYYADRKKLHPYSRKPKHDYLESGNCLPNRFYFVLPFKLASSVTIPQWAGLIVVKTSDEFISDLRRVKAAPRLHSKKIDAELKLKVLGSTYHRFWKYRLKNSK